MSIESEMSPDVRGHADSTTISDEWTGSPETPPHDLPGVTQAVKEAARVDVVPGPAPTWRPGDAAVSAGASGVVTHLWSYDSAVGTWVYLSGVGWKRLSPASEHGHSHMTLLSALATNANIPVYYNLDSSGNIDQMYV